MKTLSLEKMEGIEGGTVNWSNAVGCGAGVALVVLGSGYCIFAFCAGVEAIMDYCPGVVE